MVMAAIVIGIVLCLIFVKVFDKPMDDSGEFNGNIFPFEIKKPEEWFNSKEKEQEKEQEKEKNHKK